MNDNKVKIFEYLDTLVKMSRSKGNGASLIIEEEEIAETIKEHDLEIEEIENSISLECYDASAEMADRNIEIITKKLIQQLKSKIKDLQKELDDLKKREEDYNSQLTVLRKNKQSHEEYIDSLKSRNENTDNEEIADKYKKSISKTEEKIIKVSQELETKNLEYKLLQERLEELANELIKLNDNLKEKESLLAETQANLKNKDSYLDQSKVNKAKSKIEDLEIKKKKLNNRVEEIHENTQYLVAKIKEDINSDKEASAYEKDIIELINKAHQVPYMNVEANKRLEEELLKATQARDSFALEIDQKNYSLLETLNPGKIRIDYLKDRIEKWNVEREELKDRIFAIDNDQKYNYQDKYEKLNDILDTMKKELSEFEKAYENNDEINLTSKSNLKLSIEEKKREIFEAENIMSQFRHDESEDITFANHLYTHEISELDNKIASAEKEIEEIKDNMISRKSGLIDITTQNRDKDKLKELAVKVIDIKHRRQFADKPIDIAKELEQLLEIEIIPYIEVGEIEEEEEIEDIKVIVGDSSVDLNINMKSVDEEIIDEELAKEEIEEPEEIIESEDEVVSEPEETTEDTTEEEIELVIPPKRGIKVVEQSEIEDEEDLVGDDTVITINEEPTPVEDVTEEVKLEPVAEETAPNVEIPVVEEIPTTEEVVEIPVVEEPAVVETSEDDVITLSNENVEPEDLQPAVVEEPVQEAVVAEPAIEPIPVDEQELSIGAMFGNSSQTADNNDNIVLDSDLSVELDQYLKDLDLPNS